MSRSNKGISLSKEHRKKISESLKKHKRTKIHCEKIGISSKKRLSVPENNPNWKGENVGYIGIHIWLRKNYGNPDKCVFCNLKGNRETGKWNICWSLLKGLKYERKKENFIGLCNKCHRNYDNTESWNKNISKSKLKYYSLLEIK